MNNIPTKAETHKLRATQESSTSKSNKNSAGRWTNLEHNRFTEALRIYGKNWKKVEDHVGSRTGAQVRSHAQKFFLKVQKKLNVEKGKVIENLDNVESEKSVLSQKLESPSLKKRTFDEMEMEGSVQEPDQRLEIDHKDLLIIGQQKIPQKEYFDIDEKLQNYPTSFHKESFEYDSKMHAFSHNSRASRNNEIFDIDEKAYESYFKDKESFDVGEKFGYSTKHKESMEIDEKFHGLLKHRESFDVDNKDYRKLENLKVSQEFTNTGNMPGALDEGILNLKMAAEEINNNILRLERQYENMKVERPYKNYLTDPPIQLMDLPTTENQGIFLGVPNSGMTNGNTNPIHSPA